MEKHTLNSYIEVLTHTKQLAESMHDTVEGYTKMTTMLATAVDGLESTAGRVQREVAHVLASFIDEAERAINFYTDASWNRYMTTLAHAKAVHQGRKTKLVELLKAKNDLRDAKNALVYDQLKVSI